MRDLIASVVVVGLGLWVALALTRTHGNRIQRVAVGALVAHVLATFAQIYITRDVYGYGDMLTYVRNGEMLSRYARVTGHLDTVFEVALGGEPLLPFWIHGLGRSTGCTAGLSGLLHYYVGGIYAVNLTMGVFSFSGKLAIFSTIARDCPRAWRMPLLIGCTLVPSMVFWSAGLLKEATAMGALGWTIFGLDRVRRGRVWSGAVLAALGAFVVSLSKAYLLFPLAASAGVYLYWRRALRGGRDFRLKPFQLVLIGAIGAVAIVGLGELFPRYAVGNLEEEAMRLQEIGGRVRGGSTYLLIDPESSSAATRVLMVPLAVISSLFRPFPFEVSNALMAVSALETLGFIGLILVTWRRHSIGGALKTLRQSPMLMFCLSMTLLIAAGVGLTSTNLGTLSRYRIPMMPFYVGMLLVLASRRVERPAREAEAPASAIPPSQSSARASA